LKRSSVLITLKDVINKNPRYIIGFFDDSSPQLTANTQKLWSFTKPLLKKNTTGIKANSFGFYAINGNNVLEFKENSKKKVFVIF